jgi:hypothetical protein
MIVEFLVLGLTSLLHSQSEAVVAPEAAAVESTP